MSRVEETSRTIDRLKASMIGTVNKQELYRPELYMLPILSEIAISLAELVDMAKENNKTNPDKRNNGKDDNDER